MMSRGGTFMKERPVRVSPKSSEQDPPAANQPTGGGDLGPDSVSKTTRTVPDAGSASGRGKPDGEVDTGR
jgi:hypothetical protein